MSAKSVSDEYYKAGQRLSAIERDWADAHREHRQRIRAIRAAMRRMEEEGDNCLLDLFPGDGADDGGGGA